MTQKLRVDLESRTFAHSEILGGLDYHGNFSPILSWKPVYVTTRTVSVRKLRKIENIFWILGFTFSFILFYYQ